MGRRNRLRALRIASLAVLSLLASLTLGSAQGTPRKLDRALSAQRELAAERPDDPAVLNDLGNLLAVAGDTRGAEAAYRRALELAPGDAGVHFNYGLLLAESGERLAALRQFRTVTDLEPRHAWAWYQIGETWDAWRQERL
jgi:Flp pilus assembly protein TadD